MGRIIRTLACLLWLGAVLPTWADDYELYIVNSEDGAYTSLDFANLRSLSFQQSGSTREGYTNLMSANYLDGSSVSYNLAGYSALLFENPQTVGIDGLWTDPSAAQGGAAPLDGKPFMYAASQLTALSAGTLCIHRLDGRQVSTQTLAPGERISLQTLPTGIYIVSMNGRTEKILVK